MKNVDLVVFLRPDDRRYEFSDNEDPVLRATVDKCLEAILLDSELELVDGNHPVVIEAIGSTEERIEALTAALLARAKNTTTDGTVII